MITILLVEDNELVRVAIRELLSGVKNIKIIGEAATGKQALLQARNLKPQLILLDFKLPDISGLEVSRKLLRILPQQKILILTSIIQEIFLARLLKMGVSGCVSKAISAAELIKAINETMRDQRILSPQVAERFAINRMTEDQSLLKDLSDRELEIALMICQGKTVDQVAADLHLSTKTINTYRYRLFDKLNIGSDVQLTLLLYRENLVTID